MGVDVAGEHISCADEEPPQSTLFLSMYAVAGDGLVVSLTLSEAVSVTLLLENHVYRLPEMKDLEFQPCPAWMVPSPTLISDATVIRHTIIIH
jgi:hypothetical protein